MVQFAIYALPVGNGTVALSPLPGRSGGYVRDLGIIRDWQPDLVISMTTGVEILQEGAGGLGDDLRAHNIEWAHLPVADFGAPSPATDVAWIKVSATATRILSRAGRVLVHCRGGCGRSGMIVLRLMVENGELPETALSRLRAVRPCAVETEGQMDWATFPQSSS
ncbi:Dual specificity phosphatase, catalytic domain [Ruegeria denitrificans]|uniref:Dual specificity phosphatase, catalytic domain n=1 Tax=Ruegeria denitrificans TaxID=1715692 RepID=A0A0P1IGC3_9RHOB|nr:protein-tyrosine phosphatase family protein [Ruegeria denitrificans]CUK11210.1 Dual specificity phosphatase, catalytic domain [Ruegeria denitrificans]